MASPHRLLPIKTRTLLAIGTADADVPTDMLVSFHKESVDAHKLLRKVIEEDGVGGTSSAPHSGSDPIRTSTLDVRAAPEEPKLLLIENADHYKILDASENAWLELFAAIELQLQLQL